MEESIDYRCWDELIPDALGLIFRSLSLQEVLTVIPRVCKSWDKVVMGPYCWQEIDIVEWSDRCQPDHRNRMLRMLITRSSGSLRKLCVSGLNDDSMFSFVAEHAGSLHTLRLPRSELSDPLVQQIAQKLCTVTFLDLSSCTKIGACALEAIGKHCKFLVRLHRTMHPLDMVGKLPKEDEAHAIASTMPKLKHLVIAYLPVNTSSVLEILMGCRELEFLDLRGCWNVRLDEKFVKEKLPNLKVLGPLVVDCYERNEWDGCSDYSDSSGYLAWEFDGSDDDESDDGMWDEEEGLEELEVRFYDGFEDAVYDWPASP